MIKIKDFAKETGFSVRMLRYLEEIGILIPVRDQSNYRLYSHEQIKEAIWIKGLQNLGVQLKEIEILKANNPKLHLKTLKNVLVREQEIAELKSETIPELKSMIDFLTINKTIIQNYYSNFDLQNRKMKTLGGEAKFQRTAYNIATIKKIADEYLKRDEDAELISIDQQKFNEWFKGCDYTPMVFSIFDESSFSFGRNMDQKFIEDYEKAWKAYFPKLSLAPLNGFLKDDVPQLMGHHDIIIRCIFKNKKSGVEVEIVIPYTPVFILTRKLFHSCHLDKHLENRI